MERLTAHVSELAAATMHEPLPDDVARAARRTLLNALGNAIGAAHDPSVDLLMEHAGEHGGDPRVDVPGRPERTDALNAALIIGQAAHVNDFDDTHLQTVIHPGAATLGALLAAGVTHNVTGEQALHAFALGCEVQLRVGVAMSPSHYDAGWHITGTCGVIGAAVTAGLVAGLDAKQLANAIAIAASQTVGLRDAFGTMTKAFHAGKAAANGVLAADLAANGFTASDSALEHHQGLLRVLADDVDTQALTRAWGEDWELLRNTFKPYPCGIVAHPLIDGAVAICHDEGPLTGIDQVVVRCNPLVPELMGNAHPTDGLEARFSAAHGVAVGLIDGAAGLAQYTDERVRAVDVTELRAKVRLVTDDTIARDAAMLEVHQGPGALWHHVEHARGSLDRPLTDEELREKVQDLVEPVLPEATTALVREVEGLAQRDDLRSLLDASTPERG